MYRLIFISSKEPWLKSLQLIVKNLVNSSKSWIMTICLFIEKKMCIINVTVEDYGV